MPHVPELQNHGYLKSKVSLTDLGVCFVDCFYYHGDQEKHAHDFVGRHSATVLSHIFDFPSLVHQKYENLVYKVAKPFLGSDKRYLFRYTSVCDCGATRSTGDEDIAALLDAASGAEALVEAALLLDADAPLIQMFMGREPLSLEINEILRGVLEIIKDMLSQGNYSHDSTWYWGRKMIEVRNFDVQAETVYAAEVERRVVRLWPYFWSQDRLSEGLSLISHHDNEQNGDLLTNIHESIAMALAETQSGMLVHELTHLVAWFSLRTRVRRLKSFDLSFLLTNGAIWDVCHFAFADFKDDRDRCILDHFDPRSLDGRRQRQGAYHFTEAVKLAQMKHGNIAAFLNASNHNFLCAAALVEKWLAVLQDRSDDTTMPFEFLGHIDAMRTIGKEVPELFGYQYMLHRPFYLARPELDEWEVTVPESCWDKIIASSRFQLPAWNAA